MLTENPLFSKKGRTKWTPWTSLMTLFERNQEKNKLDEDEIIKRQSKVKELIQSHKKVRVENEEIMKDVKMIKHPDTFEDYKKYSFRRWVGNQGKYSRFIFLMIIYLIKIDSIKNSVYNSKNSLISFNNIAKSNLFYSKTDSLRVELKIDFKYQ